MKYCAIVFLMLITASAKAQEPQAKINEYKVVGITYSSYAKPEAAGLYSGSMLANRNMYADVRRNLGITLQYSQMNFIQNSGVEFGLGLELMLISTQFNFNLPTSPDETNIRLNAFRSQALNINLPLYYVHRIELGKGFTLFPKIGLDTKVLINWQDTRGGIYTDSLNSFHYSIGHVTDHAGGNMPLENVFFNGTIGASLAWATKNGATFGVHFTMSTQLFSNVLFTKMDNIIYKKDGEVAFDSNKAVADYYYYDEDGNQLYQPPGAMEPFLVKNRLSNFSIGLSYIFGKK